MKHNRINRFMCSLWFFVPVLSLIRLSKRMMCIILYGIPDCITWDGMPDGGSRIKTYNGLQLLLHSNLVNANNVNVTDMSNPEFVILKIMIALQLIFDAILVSICLREWREKQTSKVFIRFKAVLTMGYVLTAFAIYRMVLICGNHLRIKVDGSIVVVHSSYADYYYDELEKNILFSIGVAILFIVTLLIFLFSKEKKI